MKNEIATAEAPTEEATEVPTEEAAAGDNIFPINKLLHHAVLTFLERASNSKLFVLLDKSEKEWLSTTMEKLEKIEQINSDTALKFVPQFYAASVTLFNLSKYHSEEQLRLSELSSKIILYILLLQICLLLTPSRDGGGMRVSSMTGAGLPKLRA